MCRALRAGSENQQRAFCPPGGSVSRGARAQLESTEPAAPALHEAAGPAPPAQQGQGRHCPGTLRVHLGLASQPALLRPVGRQRAQSGCRPLRLNEQRLRRRGTMSFSLWAVFAEEKQKPDPAGAGPGLALPANDGRAGCSGCTPAEPYPPSRKTLLSKLKPIALI